jgi:hypothetical protein
MPRTKYNCSNDYSDRYRECGSLHALGEPAPTGGHPRTGLGGTAWDLTLCRGRVATATIPDPRRGPEKPPLRYEPCLSTAGRTHIECPPAAKPATRRTQSPRPPKLRSPESGRQAECLSSDIVLDQTVPTRPPQLFGENAYRKPGAQRSSRDSGVKNRRRPKLSHRQGESSRRPLAITHSRLNSDQQLSNAKSQLD